MLLIQICWLSDRVVESGKMGICRSREHSELILGASQYVAENCRNIGLYHHLGLTGYMYGCEK